MAKMEREEERKKILLYLELQSSEKIWGQPGKQRNKKKHLFCFQTFFEHLKQKVKKRECNFCKVPF